MLLQTSSEELQKQNDHGTEEESTKTSMPEDSNESHIPDSTKSTYNENAVEQTKQLHKGSTPNDMTASRSDPVQDCSPRHPSFSPLTPATSSDRPSPAFPSLSSMNMPPKRRKTTLQGGDQYAGLRITDARSMTLGEIAASQGKDSTLVAIADILRARTESASRTSPPPPPSASTPPTDQSRHPSLPPTVLSSFPPSVEAPQPLQITNGTPATFTKHHLNTLLTRPHSPQNFSTPLPSGPKLPKIWNFSRLPSTIRPARDPHAVVEEKEIHCRVCDEQLAAHERMKLVRCDVGGCGKWYHLECLGMGEPPSRRVAWECPGHGRWGLVVESEVEDDGEEEVGGEEGESEGGGGEAAAGDGDGEVDGGRRRSGRIMASASARGAKKTAAIGHQPPAPTTSTPPPSPMTSKTAAEPEPEPEPQQAPHPPSTQEKNTVSRRRRHPLTADSSTSSKTFVCKLCNRHFRRQEHLKRHYTSLHTYEKPFECGDCGRRFSRADNLGQHSRVHGVGGGGVGRGEREGGEEGG